MHTYTTNGTFTVALTASDGVAQDTLTKTHYITVSDFLFADGFESGDFAAWSAEEDSEGDLSVTTAAALVGTQGMAALIDNTTAMYVRDDTPASEPRYRARFYFDPNAVTIASGNSHDLFAGRTSSTVAVRVQLQFNSGAYRVRAQIRNDAGSDTSTAYYTIADAPHFIEVDWAAATSAGTNDGYLSLWIDGVLQETKSGIDNDTLRVEQARLGAPGSMEAGIAGTEYFDAFESRRQTYIGPVDSGGSLLTTTIAYTYDALYRLTGANYSGAYTYTFAYRYDAVGNRTVQTRTITSTLVMTYTYDAANRLINAGGVAHTWDANGNLLNDGSATYGYDFENRLISTTLSGATTQFVYNGDGIRLRLIEASTLTTYTQDYAAPLPVVLQAKTGSASTQYLYSLGTRPLAEYEAVAWEYLLGDPLGSVRQLADASGNVTLLKSYEPYGSVLNSQGTATSVFAYAGEQIDSTGLIYLRARYMQPRLGIFLSRDPVSGDVLRPGSMNGWNYAEGSPVIRVDPTGLYWWKPGLFDASERGVRHANIHVRIQALMMAGRADEIHAEYTIPGTNLPVDLLDSITGEMWEIKPWESHEQAIVDLDLRLEAMYAAKVARLLRGRNPIGLEYDWNDAPTIWRPGRNFPPGDIYLGNDDSGWYEFYAAQTELGVILWWKYRRQQPEQVPYPIVLPDEVTWSDRNTRPGWQPALAPATYYCPVPPHTSPRTELQTKEAIAGIGVGGGVGVLLWWVAKLLSPLCGPLAPACAVGF